MKHELNTDTEETMNRSEQRLAAIERKEQRGRVNREPREPRETISSKRRAKAIPARRSYLVKAVGGGKRWVGKRVNLGKGGCEIGKWRSFSHLKTGLTRLFPRFSTQVVDFPHLAHLSIFWEEGFHHRETEAQSKEEMERTWEN